MKTFKLQPLFLILLSVLFFSSPSFGGKKDSIYPIEIIGKVLTPEWDLARSYNIELMCQNRVIDSSAIVDDEDFLLRVKKNSLYTIRITKPGYLPLVVTVDTRVKNYNDPGQKYNLDNSYFVTLHGFQLALSVGNEPK